uniref:protein mono-ADP-ribosyltransferase PARP12-like n=1 Tax=Myxine glutinosa TaxID=7769 RepID=UPI00358F1486
MAGTDSWFVRAFHDLCEKGASLELQQLLGFGSETGSNLQSHREHFVLGSLSDGASCRVFAKTGLRVCPLYGAGKCVDGNCPKLHVCRFFIVGACKYGDRCKYAHNLDEPCTVAKLSSPSYVLERPLSQKGLFSVLLLNDRCLLPEICSHYNTGDGSYGNCSFQGKCTKLHVCRHFILDDCKYGNNCKRSHDLLAPNTKKLLKNKGFGDHMTDLLEKLRKVAHMQDATRADVATGATSNDSQMVANMAAMSVSPDSENNTEKDEICLYYLRKHCQYKDKCQCMHFDLPYRWQWHPWGWDWRDIPKMEEVEKDFCNPDFDSHNGDNCKVDFLNMKLGGHPVRRFSTANSISKPGHFVLTTKWCWYWKVEDGCWREYVSQFEQYEAYLVTVLEECCRFHQTACLFCRWFFCQLRWHPIL